MSESVNPIFRIERVFMTDRLMERNSEMDTIVGPNNQRTLREQRP